MIVQDIIFKTGLPLEYTTAQIFEHHLSIIVQIEIQSPNTGYFW